MTYKEFAKIYKEKTKTMKKKDIILEWKISRSLIAHYLQSARLTPERHLNPLKSKLVK